MLEPPVIDIDPYSREVIPDPYPFHERLRETAPVVRIARHGIYATGRFDEVATVIQDYDRFMVSAGIGIADNRKPGSWRQPGGILEHDPPAHTQLRSALGRILSPAVLRSWQERFVRGAKEIVDRAIDLSRGGGEVDGVDDVAEAFVMTVFPPALGVEIRRDYAVALGNMNFNQIGPYNDLVIESMKLCEPMMEWYEASIQREAMVPGGFGEAIYAAMDRGDIPPGSAPAQVRQFLRGGFDTTIAGIGFTLNQLARAPDQWDMVRADPAGGSRAAFEEAIRHESPSIGNARTVVEETVLSGYRLEKDVKIVTFIGAANRDPRRWEAPDRFDMTRKVLGRHIAFGMGVHKCIGQMIARAEAEAVLSELARRVARIELAGEPRYRLLNSLRTLDSLPLRLIPA
ncbi:MAG: cytochrome P450 [Sphingobium sp.]